MSEYEGHTPSGCWQYHVLESTGPNASIDILDSMGFCICNIPEVTGYRDSEESLAIAKLIADAPLLAEKVQELAEERDALLELEADCAIEKQGLAEQNAKMLAMLKAVHNINEDNSDSFIRATQWEIKRLIAEIEREG